MLKTTAEVRLRDVEPADVEAFFHYQEDAEACAMAAFPTRDHDAFTAHWSRLLADDTKIKRTVVADGAVAGNICSWHDAGQQLLGYWIGREHWGRGVATRVLELLAVELPVRPLVAHVAVHNVGSIRVLEKCGFRRDEAREQPAGPDDVQEFVLVLGG